MTALDEYIEMRQRQEAEQEAKTQREEYVKKKLGKYRDMLAQYRARKELYDQTFPIITPIYDDMPKSESQDCRADRVADERWKLRGEVDDLLLQLQREMVDMIRMVRGIEPIDETVIIRRYMLGQTFEKIAETIPCDRATIFRWHRRGIRRIAENMRLNATVCDTGPK